MNFDELRKVYPAFGFALYALEPGAPVTLEVHSGGEVYDFKGGTAQEAIDRGFPPAETPPQPEPNVFD